MVNTWDDKNDELDECIENPKANDAQLSRNGSAAISFTRMPLKILVFLKRLDMMA